jgi:hypothetical protein
VCAAGEVRVQGCILHRLGKLFALGLQVIWQCGLQVMQFQIRLGTLAPLANEKFSSTVGRFLMLAQVSADRCTVVAR